MNCDTENNGAPGQQTSLSPAGEVFRHGGQGQPPRALVNGRTGRLRRGLNVRADQRRTKNSSVSRTLMIAEFFVFHWSLAGQPAASPC